MRTPAEHATATAIIRLMNGVLYRTTHEAEWRTLEDDFGPVHDHFQAIGVSVVVDDLEGYAYLRTIQEEPGASPLPRLVRRRALTYNVSLLLLLLRKRLAEFESSGDDGKLVLSRDQIVELVRVFLADSTNEARVVDQVDATINQVTKLGFLSQLRGHPEWEVRRIIKAYVDAETMSDFAAKLASYAKIRETGDV